jgi:hypothetical protein
MTNVDSANSGSDPQAGLFPAKIPRSAVRLESVIRASQTRSLAALMTYFVAPFLVFAGAVVFLLGRALGEWVDISIFIGTILLVTGLVWLMMNIATSFGVILTPEGVEILDRTLSSQTLVRRAVRWSDLDTVRVSGLYSESIALGHSAPLMVDQNEARAILSDPRCPLHGRVPAKDSKRLGLSQPP